MSGVDSMLALGVLASAAAGLVAWAKEHDFEELWLQDFEFFAPPGERPVPICMVAFEVLSGRWVTLDMEELAALKSPPFRTDGKSLTVAYYSSAELGCYLSLGWQLPEAVLDLFVEFRARANGLYVPSGAGLLGALTYFDIGTIAESEKDQMRQLAMRGPPFTTAEMEALLAYCRTDVVALARLLPVMVDKIDVPRALLRGRFMRAAAHIEAAGIPLDARLLARLRAAWEDIKQLLIRRVDEQYGVFDGLTFKADRFADYLARTGIPWPRLESGRLDLSDTTFRQMARAHPQVAALRELRHALAELRLESLAVGKDDRNRTVLSVFRAKSGRNQPSNSQFIFGPSRWLRGLIRPPPGHGVAYLDYAQQEFGIAAALSGDPAMMEAYTSGDPYLAFAKQAGAVPADATKHSHSEIREQFKQCALGVQYGMGPTTLAQRLGSSAARARELLDLHRRTYSRYWQWSGGAVSYAMLHGGLWTTFGWPVQVAPDPNPRSLGNFLMQANGAEMLRLACCLATEAGIEVCAPVHDALLIYAPLELLDAKVEEARELMAEASRIVLSGFTLTTDAKVVRYPDRYMDKGGQAMWDTVWAVVGEHEASTASEPFEDSHESLT